MRLRIKIFSIILGFILPAIAFLPLHGQANLIVKLRFYEGLRTIGYEPPTVIISSYLNPLVSANIPSSLDPAEERKQIRKVFNLIDVRLLTEADLTWESSPYQTMTHVLRFDSREMLVAITPMLTAKNQFQIGVYEQVGQERIALLETEIIVPQKNIAVFGFESKDGIPYFLSLHIFPSTRIKPAGGEKPRVGGAIGGVIEPRAGGAVRAIGNIKPPALIKRVDPVYPEEARKMGVEGVVILEVETDTEGNVVRVKLLRSIPLLDQAAIEAVKQWKYEPAIIDGKPTGLIFTVTVAFRLTK